jgi:hypothetical protein
MELDVQKLRQKAYCFDYDNPDDDDLDDSDLPDDFEQQDEDNGVIPGCGNF